MCTELIRAKHNYKFPLVEAAYRDVDGKKVTKMMRDVTDLVAYSEEMRANGYTWRRVNGCIKES